MQHTTLLHLYHRYLVAILQPSALDSGIPTLPWFYSYVLSFSVSAITPKLSAYNNSCDKATLDSLDKASITITNSNGLSAEPWWMPSFTSKYLLLPKIVLTAELDDGHAVQVIMMMTALTLDSTSRKNETGNGLADFRNGFWFQKWKKSWVVTVQHL